MADDPFDKRMDDMTNNYANAKAAYDDALGLLQARRGELEAAAKELSAIGVNPELPGNDPALEERVQKNTAVAQPKKRLTIDWVYPVSLEDFRTRMSRGSRPHTLDGIYATVHSIDNNGTESHYINVEPEVEMVIEAKYFTMTNREGYTWVQVAGVGISPRKTPEENITK